MFPLRRCQEQFLVQPVDVDELEPAAQSGKKQRKKAWKNSLSRTLRAGRDRVSRIAA